MTGAPSIAEWKYPMPKRLEVLEVRKQEAARVSKISYIASNENGSDKDFSTAANVPIQVIINSAIHETEII